MFLLADATVAFLPFKGKITDPLRGETELEDLCKPLITAATTRSSAVERLALELVLDEDC